MSFDGPDVEPPHTRHGVGLPRWLEWVTSLSALVVSVSSIFIAMHNGANEDKMVLAASYPYLEIDQGNATPEGDKRLLLRLVNEGVGPAHEQSLTIQVGDRYVTSIQQLVAAALGADKAHAALDVLGGVSNQQRTRFIPAGKEQFVFSIPRTPANGQWWDALDKSRAKWRVSACYCSVFKECWRLEGDGEPQRVKACLRDEAHEYR